MEQCKQLPFAITTILLLASFSLLSCGQMTRNALSRGADGFSDAAITIESAGTSPELIQINGSVHDLTYPEDPLLIAPITVLHNGERIARTETDFDGNFDIVLPIKHLDSSALTLEFSYVAYLSLRIEGIRVRGGDIIHVKALLSTEGDWLQIDCTTLTIPIIRVDDTTSGQTFSSEDIRRSPTRGK